MSIEQKINYQLNKCPGIKKYIKRGYQLACYAASKKITVEGDVKRVSPNDNAEYFFGYYDKSPWDASGRYMLCMKAKDTWSEPDPVGVADIMLFDLNLTPDEKDYCKKLATTHTWNVQQGCMAQWLGPDFTSKILYNDLRDGKYCSVILDVVTKEEKVLPMPVYTLSADGKTALSLDFSRLHSLRLGYGYAALPEKTKGVALPDEDCIWKMDIETGVVGLLLKYTDFAKFQPRPEMQEEGSVHKVNHLMLSPNGKRFMVLYRWFCGQRKYTRLITCNVDGTDMYVLSDDDMVSHCYWKNDNEILAFERKKEHGPGYYLMKDKTQEWQYLWPQLSNDGHPSYCPTDNSLVVFDTYPSRSRVQELKICRDTDIEGKDLKVLARVFSPFKYDNDTRCDLHPRWSRDGKMVCFDSVFEGHRGLYVVDVKYFKFQDSSFMDNKKVAVILPVYKKDKVEYLSKAIESIVMQTYRDFHIYIGVDGPVGEDIEGYFKMFENQSKMTVVRFKENRGLACVLNDLLDICFKEGYEYIARMDADDISEFTRFEKQVEFMDNHPEIDVVGGAIDEIDEKGNSRQKRIVYPETPEECRAFFAKRNPHAHPAVMFRKSFFDKLNGKKYRPEYRQNQDTMLWFDGLMADTQQANIPDVVLKFRMTDTMFKKRRKGWAFAKKQFQDRLMINKGLGYGFGADVYGFAMFCMLVSPAWIKKIAYKVFR